MTTINLRPFYQDIAIYLTSGKKPSWDFKADSALCSNATRWASAMNYDYLVVRRLLTNEFVAADLSIMYPFNDDDGWAFERDLRRTEVYSPAVNQSRRTWVLAAAAGLPPKDRLSYIPAADKTEADHLLDFYKALDFYLRCYPAGKSPTWFSHHSGLCENWLHYQNYIGLGSPTPAILKAEFDVAKLNRTYPFNLNGTKEFPGVVSYWREDVDERWTNPYRRQWVRAAAAGISPAKRLANMS